MTIFGRGIEREILKQQYMDVLASRIFLEQSISSKVSCRGERMHAFGGYCAGSVLWCVVDGRHGAGKWGWIFPLDEGR